MKLLRLPLAAVMLLVLLAPPVVAEDPDPGDSTSNLAPPIPKTAPVGSLHWVGGGWGTDIRAGQPVVSFEWVNRLRTIMKRGEFDVHGKGVIDVAIFKNVTMVWGLEGGHHRLIAGIHEGKQIRARVVANMAATTFPGKTWDWQSLVNTSWPAGMATYNHGRVDENGNPVPDDDFQPEDFTGMYAFVSSVETLAHSHYDRRTYTDDSGVSGGAGGETVTTVEERPAEFRITIRPLVVPVTVVADLEGYGRILTHTFPSSPYWQTVDWNHVILMESMWRRVQAGGGVGSPAVTTYAFVWNWFHDC